MLDEEKDLYKELEILLTMRGMEIVQACIAAELPYDVVTATALIHQGYKMLRAVGLDGDTMENIFLKITSDCNNMKKENDNETL